VELDGIVVAQHANDSALRPGGGGLGERPLGEQDDPVPIREMEGDREAPETRAYDDDR
jgi:hypothetical protein